MAIPGNACAIGAIAPFCSITALVAMLTAARLGDLGMLALFGTILAPSLLFAIAGASHARCIAYSVAAAIVAVVALQSNLDDGVNVCSAIVAYISVSQYCKRRIVSLNENEADMIILLSSLQITLLTDQERLARNGRQIAAAVASLGGLAQAVMEVTVTVLLLRLASHYISDRWAHRRRSPPLGRS